MALVSCFSINKSDVKTQIILRNLVGSITDILIDPLVTFLNVPEMLFSNLKY